MALVIIGMFLLLGGYPILKKIEDKIKKWIMILLIFISNDFAIKKK
jgi:hypothetical protein